MIRIEELKQLIENDDVEGVELADMSCDVNVLVKSTKMAEVLIDLDVDGWGPANMTVAEFLVQCGYIDIDTIYDWVQSGTSEEICLFGYQLNAINYCSVAVEQAVITIYRKGYFKLLKKLGDDGVYSDIVKILLEYDDLQKDLAMYKSFYDHYHGYNEFFTRY